MKETSNEEIKVGTPVTECVGSDAYVYYVVGVKKNQKGEIRKIYLTRAEEHCNDWYANDWYVDPFDPNAENPIQGYGGKTRKGYWTTTGTVKGSYLAIGCARPSRDPSF